MEPSRIPDAWSLATTYGSDYVSTTEDEPRAGRPCSSYNDEADASDVLVYVFKIPSRIVDLLGLEQYIVYHTAILY